MGGARAFQVEATAYAEPEEEEWVVEDPKMLERVNHRGCCSPTMDSNARPKKSWTGLAFQRFLWRVASGSSWERTPECRQREEMGGYWDSQGTWLWQLGQGPLRGGRAWALFISAPPVVSPGTGSVFHLWLEMTSKWSYVLWDSNILQVVPVKRTGETTCKSHPLSYPRSSETKGEPKFVRLWNVLIRIFPISQRNSKLS